MTSKLDLQQFRKTKIVKKLSKSKSHENLEELAAPEPSADDAVSTAIKIMEATSEKKRGRKTKYSTEAERVEARKLQQRKYSEKKKQELNELKNKIKELEAPKGQWLFIHQLVQ